MLRLADQVDLFDDTGGEKRLRGIRMQLIISQLAGRPDGAAPNLYRILKKTQGSLLPRGQSGLNPKEIHWSCAESADVFSDTGIFH